MLFLVLTTVSAAAIMIFMRVSSGRVTHHFSMLAVNYLVCALLSWGHMGFGLPVPAGEGVAVTLGFGALSGCIYVSALALSQYNIPRNGVVLPAVFSRMGGLIVPLAASVFLFGEFPRPVQVVGAVVALISIVVLNYDKDHMTAGSVLPLMALFVVDGCAAAIAKVFNGFGNPAHYAHFMFYTFGMATLLCVVVLLLRGERPGGQELLCGVLVGTPNFFAFRFLLKTLEIVPAIITYPIRCVGSLAIVVLAGMLIFGERLKRHQWYALAVICVAVVLLNL